jgi:hypothetical protein
LNKNVSLRYQKSNNAPFSVSLRQLTNISGNNTKQKKLTPIITNPNRGTLGKNDSQRFQQLANISDFWKLFTVLVINLAQGDTKLRRWWAQGRVFIPTCCYDISPSFPSVSGGFGAVIDVRHLDPAITANVIKDSKNEMNMINLAVAAKLKIVEYWINVWQKDKLEGLEGDCPWSPNP